MNTQTKGLTVLGADRVALGGGQRRVSIYGERICTSGIASTRTRRGELDEKHMWDT
jgi:hypothetical protein